MPNTSAAYLERPTVPLRWWVQATMLLATFWLAFVVAIPLWAAWLVTGILAAITYGAFLAMGLARTEVRDGRLFAGGANIAVALTGPVTVLDKDETRRVHGVDADARAFLATRPYLKGSVRVAIDDRGDPTPYWLISSRRPQQLADAINNAHSMQPGTQNHP